MNKFSIGHFFCIGFILFFLNDEAIAQDIENIGKNNPIKISGSVGTNHTFYSVKGIPYRRPPYMWLLNGNLNIDIYGLNIPLSVFLSNQNREFRQPFNMYGISPRYKWLTAHLGYRNLTFSPYTLAGHTFFGAGVEANPGIFRFAAMYGRLQKAIEEDTLSDENIAPAFRRMGGGFKVGVGKGGDFIDLIFFSAKDDINSLSYVPIINDVKPAENMVFSIHGQKQIAKRLVFGVELSSSAYTRDIRSQETGLEKFNIFSPFFNTKTSTQFYNAFRTNISYNREVYSLAIGYERIEPEYRTLGTYFFNNDLENITFSPSLRLLQQRLNLNVNLGVQRNNVLNTSLNSTKRILTSLNLSFVPNSKWNFTGQYSNFTSYSRISQKFNQFQTLDTLNFFQVNESANFNTGYSIGSGSRRHGISLNLSYQTANETFGEEVTGNKSKFFNSIVGYRYSLLPQSLTVSTGINANRNVFGTVTSFAVGPTASISKTFLEKKLRTTFTTTYNNIINSGSLTGRAINLILYSGYTVNKRNTFNMNILFLNKSAKTSRTTEFTELTGMVGYVYSF